jgi:hypothetical protein
MGEKNIEDGILQQIFELRLFPGCLHHGLLPRGWMLALNLGGRGRATRQNIYQTAIARLDRRSIP